MKKLIALIAAVAALAVTGLSTSSCKPIETGLVMYHVDLGNFYDNMDILAYSIDEGFKDGGLTKMEVGAHYWELTGEKNACNEKAKKAFLNRCQKIDKDRSLLGLPLALKGVTIKLIYTYQGDHELCSYTFVEKDL